MRPLAIYIHYPFCKSKCPYCDFNSHVREAVDAEIWRNAYLSELEKWFRETGERPVTSVFFGGGTPSLMPPQTTEAILRFIDGNWGLAENAEITLEANPTSVEYEKFKAFRAAGVNRVSIGVQSFDAEELQFLGREHSANEAKTAIEYAANIFPRYSFDLIYALPRQKLSDWEKQLALSLTLAGGHISLYQLTIEQGTNFYHQYERGVFKMPEDSLAADFYELTQQICEAHGLPAYEISNHAAPGQESAHNLTYWRYGEYLGIGPGAHGRINGQATAMTKSPEKWLEEPLESSIELSEREKLEEAVMMGIRLKEGIGLSPELRNVELLVNEGFVEIRGERLHASPKGLLMLNSVTGKLLG